MSLIESFAIHNDNDNNVYVVVPGGQVKTLPAKSHAIFVHNGRYVVRASPRGEIIFLLDYNHGQMNWRGTRSGGRFRLVKYIS